MMLLLATSNDVGVNVRLVGYGLSISRYQGIYNQTSVLTSLMVFFERTRQRMSGAKTQAFSELHPRILREQFAMQEIA